MGKGQMAEMVKRKLQKKKLQEQQNIPHRQILQLLVLMEIEYNQQLNQQIDTLKRQLERERQNMQKMEEHCLELESTGKKPYPRIIINPDFIATEHVKPIMKEFYRKASNTFLREDIYRNKNYQTYQQKRTQIQGSFATLKNKEIQVAQLSQNGRKTTNSKRKANLEQDLRLRGIKSQQESIKLTIENESEGHKDLLAQYELKKTQLHKRVSYSEGLEVTIKEKKDIISKIYNPLSYREFVTRIKNIRFKNEVVQKNINALMIETQKGNKLVSNYEEFLQNHTNLFITGRSKISSKKRRSIEPFSMRKQSFSERTSTIKLSDSKFEKTPSTSLGKTARSETSAWGNESSKKKRIVSHSLQLMKQINQ